MNERKNLTRRFVMNNHLIESEIKNKIDYWLERASSFSIEEGLVWYSECNNFCSDLATKYNISVKKVAGILSALSPMKEYKYNQKLVKEFLECQSCGHLSNQIKKCLIIYNGYDNDSYILNVLVGRKTSSFYHNIVYPTSSDKITIDFRMWKYFKPDSWKHITTKRYDLMGKCFLEKALEHHVVGNQLQAILWLTCKYDKN